MLHIDKGEAVATPWLWELGDDIIVESKDDTDSRGSCGGGEEMRSGSETDLSSLADDG